MNSGCEEPTNLIPEQYRCAKPGVIAIDFDDTLTLDLVAYSMAIHIFRGRGHKFVLVSSRMNTEENIDTINEVLDKIKCQMPIYLTSGQPKADYMTSQDVKVTNWWDDNPRSIVAGI